MRHGLALAALLLPLTGCVAMAPPVGYGYGYGPPGYPGAYPQPDYGYPGFAYNDGSPTLFVEGATLPLIFYGGGWGYYDGGHHWHRAPEGVERHLSQRYPGGAGYHPWGGGQGARQEGYRPEGYRPEGYRPEGMRPEGFRHEGVRPEGPRPEGSHAGGYPAGGGPPPGGPRPQAQVPAAAPVQRAAAPAARAEAPQRHREDEHH